MRFNPFPRGEAEQYIDTPERLNIFLFDMERRRLCEYASEVSNSSVSFVVTGGWGTGKSLFLLYFYRLLREKFGSDNVVLVYVKAPSSSYDILARIYDFFAGKGLIKRSRREMSRDDLLGVIRDVSARLVDEGRVVYIAVDQLESVLECLLSSSESGEVGRLAETLRGGLSAMLGRRYALGVSAIDVYWRLFSEGWESIRGLDIITLRPLLREEAARFIESYLDIARDNEYINGVPELREAIKNNPLYPFTMEAVNELWAYSRGVERYLCSWASKALDLVVEQNIPEIGVDLIRIAIDQRYEFYITAGNEVFRYHYTRVVPLVREIMAWFSENVPSANIVYLGQVDNVLLISVKDKPVAIINIFGFFKSDHVKYIKEIIDNGVKIGNRIFKPEKVLILLWVSKRLLPSKTMDVEARMFWYENRDKVLIKRINRDDVLAWGRLAAYYAIITGCLPDYLSSDKEREEEKREILRILGISDIM